ncbi:MAG: CHAT domain-containing protein [Chloroflexi bacterium]|nr:CHAT domain-containing protein [Chloroflexota bacterium]
MKDLVIRVGDASDQQPYPVALFFDNDDQDWFRHPKITGSLPREPAPLRLSPLAGGQPLSVDEFIPFLLTRPQWHGYLDIGQYLYDLLHSSGIGEVWDRLSSEHAAPRGGGLRTVLDIEPSRLKRLPWETLMHEQRACFLDAENPFVRGPIDFTAQVVPYLVPIRVLVVVAEPDDQTLRWPEELDAIRSGLLAFKGRVESKFLVGVSPDDLFAEVESFAPEVLHLIGHGVQVPGLGPALRFRNTSGTRQLGRQDVVNRLTTRVGRLAVLNACRTEQLTPGERVALSEQTWSLAQSFCEAGYHAVIGMQADIPSAASVAFSRTLYAEIGNGSSIEVAVSQARKKIGENRDDSSVPTLVLRDWVLPALLVSVPPQQVLAESYAVTPETLTRIERSDEFRQIEAFVDRTDARRDVWRELEGRAKNRSRELLLVHGATSLGKTWLVTHALRTCAWHGKTVYYRRFPTDTNLNLLQVLRIIRDGSGDSFVAQGLPNAARNRFTHDLNFLSRGKLPPPYAPEPGDAEVPDTSESWEPGELIRRVFSSLQEMLRSAAQGAPLILALDQLEKIEPTALTHLAEHLFKPIARGDVEPVRIVVALPTSQLQAPGWPVELTSMARVIPVTEIDGDFRALAREFLQHHGYKVEDLQDLIDAYSRTLVGGKWQPALLGDICNGLAHTSIQKAR